jgi:hypothetical protein
MVLGFHQTTYRMFLIGSTADLEKPEKPKAQDWGYTSRKLLWKHMAGKSGWIVESKKEPVSVFLFLSILEVSTINFRLKIHNGIIAGYFILR